MRAESGTTLVRAWMDAGLQLVGQGIRPVEVGLTDVEQDEDGLLGQEAEPADAQLVVGRQPQVTDGPTLGEGRQDALQDLQLPLVGLPLGRRAVASGGAQLLDALLDHAKVGQRELQLQLLQVAARVDAQQRVGHGVVGEGPHDVQEGVSVAQAGQLVGRDVAVRRALGRHGRRRQVHVGDVGRHLALGSEDAVSRTRRSSGTLTTPVLTVRPPKPPVSAVPRVRELKTVVLPERARPTMAICI